MKDYKYKSWEMMRIFPKFKQLEEEYDKMSILLDESSRQIARLKRQRDLAIRKLKELEENGR